MQTVVLCELDPALLLLVLPGGLHTCSAELLHPVPAQGGPGGPAQSSLPRSFLNIHVTRVWC